MVQIHGLVVLKNNVIASGYVEGKSWLSWFYSSQITEFVQYFSKLVSKRAPTGKQIKITEKNFVGYVHSLNNGLCIVLVTDEEYPSRVAFNVLHYVVTEFEKEKFWDLEKDFGLDKLYLDRIKSIVEKYQDPVQTDKILQVKKNLDETKTILVKSIDSLLERGEKLEDLVAKTNELSSGAKDLYKVAYDNNRCCIIL